MKLKRDPKRDPKEKTERKSSPIVSWIAILIGVFMVVVGGIILLWGLSFQAQVGEIRDLDGGELTGGPILIPGGAAFLTFGTLWIYHGLKGFKKREEDIGFKNCPNCGKKIEDDLNFCYHCTTTFTKEGDEDIDGEKGDGDVVPDERDDEGFTNGQKDRMKRQEERRRSREENKASTLDELKVRSKGQ